MPRSDTITKDENFARTGVPMLDGTSEESKPSIHGSCTLGVLLIVDVISRK
jgi:hypothetical protein